MLLKSFILLASTATLSFAGEASTFSAHELSTFEHVSPVVHSSLHIPSDCGICRHDEVVTYNEKNGHCKCRGEHSNFPNHVVACYPPLHPNRGFAVCAEHKGCGIFCKDPLVLNAAGDDCVCPPGTTLHYNSAKHKYTCKHPTPSMRARALQHRSAMISQVLIDPRCPLSETACPLNFGSASSSTSGDGGYECIDTSNAVQSCGGCLGRGGVDCTAIEGVKGVGCEEGVCTVFSCEKGYMKTRDGCVKTVSIDEGL